MPAVEAVIVSVGYADFLAWTLPFNKSQFDRIVVITSPADAATQRVCEFHHVECLVTDAMYAGGAVFNKGQAVNAGLDRLPFKGWCVHLDADIVVPPRFRELLDLIPLAEANLYSADRVMVADFPAWANFLTEPVAQHAMGLVKADPFVPGHRLAFPDKRWRGWIPLGYFQMFHRANPAFDTKPWYPETSPTAANSDLAFAEKWGRQNRVLLPDFYVYHLDSQGANPVTGANWEGRATPRFGL